MRRGTAGRSGGKATRARFRAHGTSERPPRSNSFENDQIISPAKTSSSTRTGLHCPLRLSLSSPSPSFPSNSAWLCDNAAVVVTVPPLSARNPLRVGASWSPAGSGPAAGAHSVLFSGRFETLQKYQSVLPHISSHKNIGLRTMEAMATREEPCQKSQRELVVHRGLDHSATW